MPTLKDVIEEYIWYTEGVSIDVKPNWFRITLPNVQAEFTIRGKLATVDAVKGLIDAVFQAEEEQEEDTEE